MSTSDHDIHVLNNLVGALKDAVRQYRSSAATGRDPALGFNRYADAHEATIKDLCAEVTALGGPAAGEPDLLTKAGQAISSMFHTPGGGGSAAEEAEAIEGALKARFEAAMADDRTSGPVRDAVVRAFDTVKTNHDEALQARLKLSGEA